MRLFDWVGGHSTPKDEAKSAKRAQRHRKQATAVDRRGWRDHDRRDRATFGD